MKNDGKKKILFVTESLARGGMERVLVNIANVLVEKNFDVTIVCYHPSNDILPELNENVHYVYKPKKNFPVLSKIPYIKRFYKANKFKWEHRVNARALYKHYVGKEKYDVEIGFYRGPSIKIVSGSTNKKSKKLAWVHTDFKLCNPKTITNWFNSIEETKKAYTRMDNVVCVSNKAKESFEEVIGCKGKTTTIYNMIPSKKIIKECEEPIPPIKEKFTIITVGRLIPDKRQERLLSASKRLADEGYDFDVWLVGGGRHEEELKKYCQVNKINNVKFLGMQENPYSYMKNADLFVLTSYREGFALVIPEAMACGLPILSTACTGPTESLGNGQYGILVENNSQDVYNGIKSVLDDKKCLEYYREKSKERYLEFDEDKIVGEIISLF